MSERMVGSPNGMPITTTQVEANFTDLHPPLSAVKAIAESARCLFCYDAPCVVACPTSIDIPKFIHQIRTQNITGSAKTILSSNIMGGTCARVCPTEVLCEGACVRVAAGEDAVQIGQLQRHAVDGFMASNIDHPFERATSTSKRIAVIGAGPAGLACAHRAAMLGHHVTVFEAKAKSGGLNEYGLAAYKMVDDFAQKEVNFISQIGGIVIEHGKALANEGADLNLTELKSNFDAVFIGTGLGDVNSLGCDGEDKDGVSDAIRFIEDLRQSPNKTDVAIGDNVIVIGGGNTAIDAAVQAKRLGAKEVALVYRRGADQMTATEWEQNLALINGVTVHHWAKPVEVQGDDKVDGMMFEQTVLKNDKLEGTGEFFELAADQVLKAIGQVLDDGPLGGLELDGKKIKVGADYQTSISGIFAGGDCIHSGEDLTVQAVDDGAQAAHAIHDYLMKY